MNTTLASQEGKDMVTLITPRAVTPSNGNGNGNGNAQTNGHSNGLRNNGKAVKHTAAVVVENMSSMGAKVATAEELKV